MASKNQVTLTFAGDSDKLEKAFDNVGSAASDMDGKVDTASRNVGDSFDRAGEAADNVDTKAMGFRDTMTGVEDTGKGLAQIMNGDLFSGFLTLGMGVGDLASGMFNFVIPAMKSFTLSTLSNIKATVTSTASNAAHKVGLVASTVATKTMTVAQKALNLAMRANPIGIVITVLAALAAGIVVAYRKSETFRNIVKGAMEVGAAAIGFVIDKGQALLEFFQGLPGKISTAASGMWDGIKNAFRSAVNWVIDAWNGLSFTLPSISAFGKTIGGNTITVPQIPRLHSGGTVPGSPGQEVLALLEAGERVTPARQVRAEREPRPVHIENVNVQAWSDRFKLNQLVTELRYAGVV